MKRTYSVIVILTGLAVLNGCVRTETKTTRSTLTDLGFIPSEVTVGAEFQPMIYINGSLLVGTSDGIWACNISTREWSKHGLQGMNVTAIFKHPEMENRLFAGVSTDYTSNYKTLYISKDGGAKWNAAGSPVYNTQENCYEDIYCFAARPGLPDQIYANLIGGTTIAVSTDCGETWHRFNYLNESYYAYPCNIVFLSGNPDVIFQGAESPLDDAWLGRYDINSNDPVLLGNFTKMVNSSTWSNRRPNELQTYSYTGENIYTGLEGALSKVTGNTSKFIFKYEQMDKGTSSDESLFYTYIKGIWVDPGDTKHILFGGKLNDDVQPMQLYETYDEGASIYRYTDKYEMENLCLLKIVPAGTSPALLFVDYNLKKVKVLLFNNDSGK
jgi:hypothetical protein